MVFENITPGVPDPMFTLKARADADQNPNKVDLGVGIYRNAQGQYEGLQCVAKVRRHLPLPYVPLRPVVGTIIAVLLLTLT